MAGPYLLHSALRFSCVSGAFIDYTNGSQRELGAGVANSGRRFWSRPVEGDQGVEKRRMNEREKEEYVDFSLKKLEKVLIFSSKKLNCKKIK